jgi:hypothetical protein
MSIVRTIQPQLNKAMYFNATNAYISVPDSPSLVPNNGLTVMAWIYYITYRVFGSIVGKSYSAGNYTYWLYIGSGDMLYSAVYSLSFPVVSSTVAIPRYQWTNVAVTWTYPGEEGLYINGALNNKATARKDPINTAGSLTVAELRPGRLCLFGGYIAQVLIYKDKALLASEINHNGLNPNNPIRDGLVLWLDARACDVSKGICYDLSGNGNHGTMYNVSIVTLSIQIAPGMVM